MNTALWIVQGILAAMFAMAGIMKSTQPVEKLSQKMAWATRYPASTVKLIGIVELLAAAGLILPMLLNILPVLTPIAAAGLAVVMLLAIAHHLKYNEAKLLPINIILFLLAAFVAWGRF